MIIPVDIKHLISRIPKREKLTLPELIVVGLGNPGIKYINTRHNAGFWAIKTISDLHKLEFNSNKRTYKAWEGDLFGHGIVISKPKTYMNDSGLAVMALLKKYKVSSSQLMVIYDDMDISPGRLKLKNSGGPGGHNGMKSIIDHIGTNDFPRLRIGIGRPNDSSDNTSYVLSQPHSDELTQIAKALEKTDEILSGIMSDGIDTTMEWANRS